MVIKLQENRKNKILFWIDISLLQFGVAKMLQEKLDDEFYVIYDLNHHLKKSFKNQNIISFQNEWYFWDHVGKTKKPDLKYLKKIEENYKINLWGMAYTERNFYQYNPFYKFKREEILSIFEQECRFFEQVLNEVNPDFLIIKTTDFHRNYLLTEMCRARGIKILMLFASRLGVRASISAQADTFDNDLDEKKENLVNIQSMEDLDIYLKSHHTFKRNITSGGMKVPQYKKIMPSITWLTKTVDEEWKESYDHYGVTRLGSMSHYFSYSLKGRLRKMFIDRNFEKTINKHEKFVFFSLALQPERGVEIVAPFYTNQIGVITNIAKSLPVGYKLYVKEHQTMKFRHWRDTSYYKKIMALPNVKLIHPSFNTKILLENCELVITVSGTTGLEAALYKKPCIIFADANYSSLPSVYRLRSLEDLPNAIRESLKKEVKLSDVNDFINLLDRNSFPFDIFGFYSRVLERFHVGGFMVSNEISMKSLDSFFEEDREIYEMLAEEHIKKINQHKKLEKIIGPK